MVDTEEYSWAQTVWDSIVSSPIDPGAPSAGPKQYYYQLMQQLAGRTPAPSSSAPDHRFRISSGTFDFPGQ
jgi:hypothetical protein